MKHWSDVEERFASLVRLGGDERTPDHERSAACRAAIKMFTRGDMTVVSTGRWNALMDLYRRQVEVLPPDAVHCQGPFNIQGRNGWQCCKCRQFTTGSRGFWNWNPDRCPQCGHLRCNIMLDPNWR